LQLCFTTHTIFLTPAKAKVGAGVLDPRLSGPVFGKLSRLEDTVGITIVAVFW
jgi:hypothetical protein